MRHFCRRVHTLKRLQGESLIDYLTREEQAITEIAKVRRHQYIVQPFKGRLQRTWKQSYVWTAIHLIIKQSHRCYWCCALLTNKPYHIDHLIPRAKGGSNDISNLRLSCVSCNLSKSATLPMDFALSLFLP